MQWCGGVKLSQQASILWCWSYLFFLWMYFPCTTSRLTKSWIWVTLWPVYSSVGDAPPGWAVTGILFPLVLCHVCWCCSVNFCCVLICEYVQAFKRRIIFELRNSCILQDEGFPHYVSDYDCGKHLRKEHGMGACTGKPFLLQESTFLVRGYNEFYRYQWPVILWSSFESSCSSDLSNKF